MILFALALSPGGVIAWIIVGLIAGAVAGRLTRGQGFGCIGDIIVGIVGAFIGGFIVSLFVKSTTSTGFIGTTIVAIIGAIILLAVLRLIFGGGNRDQR